MNPSPSISRKDLKEQEDLRKERRECEAQSNGFSMTQVEHLVDKKPHVPNPEKYTWSSFSALSSYLNLCEPANILSQANQNKSPGRRYRFAMRQQRKEREAKSGIMDPTTRCTMAFADLCQIFAWCVIHLKYLLTLECFDNRSGWVVAKLQKRSFQKKIFSRCFKQNDPMIIRRKERKEGGFLLQGASCAGWRSYRQPETGHDEGDGSFFKILGQYGPIYKAALT